MLGSRGKKTSTIWLVFTVQDVEKLGKKGEQVLVEPGFARNWLIPQLLAKYDVNAGHGERQPKTNTPGPKVVCCLVLCVEKLKVHVNRLTLRRWKRSLFAVPKILKKCYSCWASLQKRYEDNLARQFANMPVEQKQLHQILHRLQAAPVVCSHCQILPCCALQMLALPSATSPGSRSQAAMVFWHDLESKGHVDNLNHPYFATQGVAAAMKDGEELRKSLTAESIAAAVAKQKKIAMDKRLIKLQQPITRAGLHDVPLGITLGNGEAASIQIIVSSQ